MSGYLGSIFGLRMIESVHVVEEKVEEIIIHRTFLECMFDLDPTRRLWDRTIKKRVYKTVPAMYRVGNTIMYHPALRSEIYGVTNSMVSS